MYVYLGEMKRRNKRERREGRTEREKWRGAGRREGQSPYHSCKIESVDSERVDGDAVVLDEAVDVDGGEDGAGGGAVHVV